MSKSRLVARAYLCFVGAVIFAGIVYGVCIGHAGASAVGAALLIVGFAASVVVAWVIAGEEP